MNLAEPIQEPDLNDRRLATVDDVRNLLEQYLDLWKQRGLSNFLVATDQLQIKNIGVNWKIEGQGEFGQVTFLFNSFTAKIKMIDLRNNRSPSLEHLPRPSVSEMEGLIKAYSLDNSILQSIQYDGCRTTEDKRIIIHIWRRKQGNITFQDDGIQLLYDSHNRLLRIWKYWGMNPSPNEVRLSRFKASILGRLALWKLMTRETADYAPWNIYLEDEISLKFVRPDNYLYYKSTQSFNNELAWVVHFKKKRLILRIAMGCNSDEILLFFDAKSGNIIGSNIFDCGSAPWHIICPDCCREDDGGGEK